ncbi:MAG: nuclease-related domain-containing protein [Pseudoxanthomonas sp.]
MDFTHIFAEVLRTWWWLIPVAGFATLLKTPLAKGFFGELAVRISAKFRLNKHVYRAIHNATLRTTDGTTQIDHIFVSPYGIFVVETKNMKGWIFGSEHDKQWTQRIYMHSSRFQNPLHQNYKHTKTLEALLEVPPKTIHSIVTFVGDSTFKTDMPPNVTRGGGFIRYIKSFKNPVFTTSQIDDLARRIQQESLAPSLATHREHVRHLQQRANPNKPRSCPKCGNPMVLRTAKSGSNAGREF